ncbi:MAG: SDR family oxidoreductase [Planctomycetaceae bacterium]|nr:SDR family oxidoreductase [Planctomycetaceae bacterium]
MIEAYADRWALVTGASSGIGAEFARVLAARGMHLVLAARRQELMDALAADLHTRHGTRCHIVPIDLADPASPATLVEEIRGQGITLELLVNNAGFGAVRDVESTDPELMQNLIRLNIGALTNLTYRVLPGMLERGHGAVINVASVAAFQPVAYMGPYSASKAYVLHFSEALWAEVRDRGVTVTALCPGVTQTEFFQVAGVPNWLKKHRSQSVDEVVRAALKAVERRRQYVVPGWINYLLSLCVRLAPRSIVVKESMKYFRPKNRGTDPNAAAGP